MRFEVLWSDFACKCLDDIFDATQNPDKLIERNR